MPARSHPRWLWGWLGACLWLAAAAGADSEEAFKKGIAATDLKKWAEAVEHLRAAVAENPQESEERVFLSGVFSRPYLPHFYLGWALFNQGSDHCEEALEHWQVSRQQGVIETFKRQHQDLVEGSGLCNDILLPAAITSAGEAIARATETANRLASSLADPALDGERRDALAALTEARRRFEAGKAAERFGELRGAESRADEVTRILTALASRAESDASDRLAVAVATARQAILAAHKAQESLAKLLQDPARAVIRDEHPELSMPGDGVARLRSAQDRLDRSTSAVEANAARVDAEAAGQRFEQVRQAAESAYASFVERLRAQAEGGAAMASAPRGTAALQPSLPELRPPPSESPRSTPDLSRRGEGEVASRIERLRATSEGLLGAIGSADSGSELLETQKSRLTVLILEARASMDNSTASLEGLEGRMSRSLAALQLVAGARSYLAGQASAALAILADAEPVEDRLAAQVHLFTAAARFALYRQGGAAELRRQAAADARASHALDPDLSPDPRVFSPLFRELFSSGR